MPDFHTPVPSVVAVPKTVLGLRSADVYQQKGGGSERLDDRRLSRRVGHFGIVGHRRARLRSALCPLCRAAARLPSCPVWGTSGSRVCRSPRRRRLALALARLALLHSSVPALVRASCSGTRGRWRKCQRASNEKKRLLRRRRDRGDDEDGLAVVVVVVSLQLRVRHCCCYYYCYAVVVAVVVLDISPAAPAPTTGGAPAAAAAPANAAAAGLVAAGDQILLSCSMSAWRDAAAAAASAATTATGDSGTGGSCSGEDPPMPPALPECLCPAGPQVFDSGPKRFKYATSRRKKVHWNRLRASRIVTYGRGAEKRGLYHHQTA